jgi:hypothetical protein
MESIDFTGLAARAVAGLHEVRACLLASRDGLTLAVLPEGGEDVARRALDRLETVGQPERGFLVIGDEVWVVSRRGPYLGIVVAAASAKAGLLLDRLESTLRAAEEARLMAGSAGPGRPEIPRRPRTPLHREPRVDPTRSEVRPPNVFEEMARVVSVPDKEETRRSEPSVGEASATTAWPHVIREPEAPNVGGPGSGSGSGSEPPTIIRPDSRPEPEESTVVSPKPEAEKPEFAAPEPEEVVTPEPEAEELEFTAPEAEESKVVTPEPEVEESKVTDSEPDAAKPEVAELQPEVEPMLAAPDGESEEPERPEQPVVANQPEDSMVAALEPEPDVTEVDAEEPQKITPAVGAPVGDVLEMTAPEPHPASIRADFPVPETKPPTFQEQLEALELSSSAPEPMQEPPTAEPDKADEVPSPAVSTGGPAPLPQLAHPHVEPPKTTPHYTPPDILLGEMGRVVAEESTPADILPPGVSPAETLVTPSDAAAKDTAKPGGTKAPEGSKERGDETEVDPVALAREFSQLFDEPERNS